MYIDIFRRLAVIRELIILATPNDASKSNFFNFSFKSGVNVSRNIFFVSGYSKILFKTLTPLGVEVPVGIKSSSFKSFYFLFLGNSSSSSNSSFAVGLFGVVVLIKSSGSSLNFIKSSGSSLPKSIKSGGSLVFGVGIKSSLVVFFFLLN